MHLFNLGQGADGLVESRQCGLAGIGKLHFHKGDMGQPQAFGIDHGAIAENIAFGLQALDPRLARSLGKIDPAAEFGDAQTAIAREFVEYLAVDLV